MEAYNPYRELLLMGFCVVKVADPVFTLFLYEKFQQSVKESKEIQKHSQTEKEKFYKMKHYPYGRISIASIFHHPFFRTLRALCYGKIHQVLKQYGGEQDFKQMQCHFFPISLPYTIKEIRHEKKKFDKYEAYHSTKLLLKGWLNVSTHLQTFIQIRGNTYLSCEVPPGSMVLYNEKQITVGIAKRGYERFYVSCFLSPENDLYTDGETLQIIKNQAIPFQYQYQYYEGGTNRLKKNDFLELPPHLSLRDLGKMFPPYSTEEINLMRPMNI